MKESDQCLGKRLDRSGVTEYGKRKSGGIGLHTEVIGDYHFPRWRKCGTVRNPKARTSGSPGTYSVQWPLWGFRVASTFPYAPLPLPA